MKKIKMTVSRFLILVKVKEAVPYCYFETDYYITKNQETANSSEDPDAEMPEMCFETDIFDDVIDSVQRYLSDLEAGEEKDAVRAFLTALEAVPEEPADTDEEASCG